MKKVLCPNLLSDYELVEICKESEDDLILELGFRLESLKEDEIINKEYVDELKDEIDDLRITIDGLEDDMRDYENEIERLRDEIIELKLNPQTGASNDGNQGEFGGFHS